MCGRFLCILFIRRGLIFVSFSIIVVSWVVFSSKFCFSSFVVRFITRFLSFSRTESSVRSCFFMVELLFSCVLVNVLAKVRFTFMIFSVERIFGFNSGLTFGNLLNGSIIFFIE